MATADEYAEWIVKNQAKKGTPEFETVAKAYQEAKAETAKPARLDPTTGMSSGEMFAAGYGSVVPRMFQSVLATDRAILEFLGPRGKFVANTFGLPTRADVAETNRLMKPLEEARPETKERKVAVIDNSDPTKPARMRFESRETRTLPGPGASGIALGNIALAAPLALAPGANTVLGSTAYGAGYGALQPAESWSEQGTNALVGGAVSGGITGGVRLAPALWKALVSPFTKGGQERIALNTIGQFAKDPDALLKANTNELIPGSRPTLAEATGDPGIAQLQRSAQAASPETASLMAESKAGRLQARKDALLSIAGPAGGKEAAEAVRNAAAQRLYSEAWKTPIDPATAKALQPEVKDLLARPSIQKAQQQALKLAKEEGEILTPKDLNGGSVKGLHYTKQAIDDQIAEAKRAGNDNLARLLTKTKEKFLGVVDELSPAYKAAREEYTKASAPINRMEIGRYLYDKLIPALSDLGAERITPAAFASALKQGDEMAKKATGFAGAKLADILTTDQINLLVNLGKDLGREAGATARAAVPGSPTAQYLTGKNALHELLNPLVGGGAVGQKLGGETASAAISNLPFGFGHFLSAMGAPAERAIQGRLGQFLTDPRMATEAAMRQRAAQQRMIPLSQIGRYGLPPVAIGGGGYAATQQ